MANFCARPRVAVLLATYNGMRWIEEQLNSILGQEGVDVVVFVSDDQSTDSTLCWCKEVAAVDERVVVLPLSTERFGGAAKNFFRLVRDVDFSEFNYISYADQDDIWLSDKLITAHEMIVDRSASAYSGNVTAYWPDGREQLLNKAQPQRKWDFLFEAAGPGCSYVLKVPEAINFKRFLIEHWSLANEVALHDWLTYAWFRSNGHRWVMDQRPKVRYRQHGGNQMGANEGFSAISRRIQLVRSGWYRSETLKIAQLVRPESEVELKDSLVRKFVLLNIGETRRKRSDRALLLVMALLGIY